MVTLHTVAQVAGMVASVAFFVQYLPQAWLNYQRKSVKGFSTSSIVIKLIGAAFLFVNATWTGEALPVICYGLFNVMQHSIFMVQFYLYSGEEKKTELPASGPTPQLQPGHPHYKPVNNFVTRNIGGSEWTWIPKMEWVERMVPTSLSKGIGKSHYLLWILFPIVPMLMAMTWPASITYTNSIKPIGQIMSHIPQVIECLKLRTTLGISMSSQHLNLIGGACGLLMCLIIPPVYKTTYLIYFNSVFQAVSTYAIAVYYQEPLFPSFGKESPALPPI